ncbi:MAG: hypothetical protein KME12_17175 [Trichocoleus desertorum ATA4-8-CV12]|jgi:hypothetical protein|nr:hypothetical protein [Trichocoleus desertorum ATA4-8-CV12]
MVRRENPFLLGDRSTHAIKPVFLERWGELKPRNSPLQFTRDKLPIWN